MQHHRCLGKGEIGEETHDSYRVTQQQQRKGEQQRCRRWQQQRQNGGQPANDQDGWLRRQDEQVDQQRHHRNLLKVKDHQRQRGNLGGQRDDERIAEEG